jgi:hypothetical protein
VDISERTGEFERHADEIVFADWGDFDRVGEFVVGSVGMGVC